jgi:hypothetical protein
VVGVKMTEKLATTREGRDFYRSEIVRQIGNMRILMISGGRVVAHENGIELPVSNGYRVRVELAADDTYTVSRIFKRGGKEWVKGKRTDVYFDEVGEAAYYAGMFRSYDEHEWVEK